MEEESFDEVLDKLKPATRQKVLRDLYGPQTTEQATTGPRPIAAQPRLDVRGTTNMLGSLAKVLVVVLAICVGLIAFAILALCNIILTRIVGYDISKIIPNRKELNGRV